MYLVLVIALGMIFAAAAELVYGPEFNMPNVLTAKCLYGRVSDGATVETCDTTIGLDFRQIGILSSLLYGDDYFQIAASHQLSHCLQAGDGNGPAANNAIVYMRECNPLQQAQVWKFHSTETSPELTTIFQLSDYSSGRCVTQTPEKTTVVMYDCAQSSYSAPHQFWYEMNT